MQTFTWSVTQASTVCRSHCLTRGTTRTVCRSVTHTISHSVTLYDIVLIVVLQHLLFVALSLTQSVTLHYLSLCTIYRSATLYCRSVIHTVCWSVTHKLYVGLSLIHKLSCSVSHTTLTPTCYLARARSVALTQLQLTISNLMTTPTHTLNTFNRGQEAYHNYGVA